MNWKAGLGIVVSALLLWWVFRGEDLGAILRHLAAADPVLLLGAGAVAVTGGLIRAVRWRLLLMPVGVPTSLYDRWKALNVGLMATNLLAARAGEVVRPYALGKLAPIPVSAGFGTIVLERVLDMIALLVLLLVTLLAPAFPRGATVLGRPIAYAVFGMIVVTVTGLAFVAVLLLRPNVAVRMARIAGRILPGRLEEKLVGAVQSFTSGLGLLRRPRALAQAMLWSLALWLWMASSFWIAFKAFGVHAGFTAAMFTQCVVSAFVAIPAAPGFVGTLQAGVSVALHEVFGIASQPVLSLSVGYHLAGFIPVTLLGLYYAWGLGLHVRSVESEAETALKQSDAVAGSKDVIPTPCPPTRRSSW